MRRRACLAVGLLVLGGPLACAPAPRASPRLTPTSTPLAVASPTIPRPTPTAPPTATPAPTDVPATPTANPASPVATATAEATAPPVSTALPSTATPKAIAESTAPPSRPGVANGPLRLRIPKIGVSAAVEAVGVDASGAMAAPSGPYTVGWFDGGYLPGQTGNAVIDGHLDYRNVGPAVFWRLTALQPGDKLLVDLPRGRSLTFVVDQTAVYPYNDAPLTRIFGPSDVPRLNLITCSGVFDAASRNYNRRFVVYARLLS